jgi:sorbitol-specific phosphotransferase system component IIBC
MKHLKTFESFQINEELFGGAKLPSREDLKKLIDAAKSKPEFQQAYANLKAEWEKLSPEAKSELKELSTETPEQVQKELPDSVEKEIADIASTANESLLLEEIDWRNIASKFFKGLGILTVSTGFITAVIAIIKIASTGTGYSELFGSTAGHVGGIGMVAMLCAIIPMTISSLLEPSKS